MRLANIHEDMTPLERRPEFLKLYGKKIYRPQGPKFTVGQTIRVVSGEDKGLVGKIVSAFKVLGKYQEKQAYEVAYGPHGLTKSHLETDLAEASQGEPGSKDNL